MFGRCKREKRQPILSALQNHNRKHYLQLLKHIKWNKKCWTKCQLYQARFRQIIQQITKRSKHDISLLRMKQKLDTRPKPSTG